MLTIPVFYVESKLSDVRASLVDLPRWVRSEEMVNDLVAVWVDIETPSRYNKDDLQNKALRVLVHNGHEPFLADSKIHHPKRDAVVDPIDGMLIINHHVKQHFEKLSFSQLGRPRLSLVYNVIKSEHSYSQIRILDIYLVGTHYQVRRAKRFLANRMSDGSVHIGADDLDRMIQLIGDGRIYIHTSQRTAIDCKNKCLVRKGNYSFTPSELLLTNQRRVLTGKTLNSVKAVTQWDRVISESANN